MIATRQGIGRGWLEALLGHIWPGYVAINFDLKDSLANGFNGALSRRLLAVVDAINEGGVSERWLHSEKLKSMVTAINRNINPKYGLQHSDKNCCRCLLFSNYETALPLTKDERRWNVIRNLSEPRDEAYYIALYGKLLDKDFISSVREFFITRSIESLNPGAHAARNEMKEAVIASAMSQEDENAMELVAGHPRDLITAQDLFETIYGIEPSNMLTDIDRRWKRMGPIARKAGIEPLPKSKDRTLFGKRLLKVWILRNPQRWRDASSADIEQELSRIPN